MSNSLQLRGLTGSNPAGFLAALGVLDIAARMLPEAEVRLSWEGHLLPQATLSGPDSLDHLTDLILADRDRWKNSAVFTGHDASNPADVKADPADVRMWFEAAAASDHLEDLRMLHGLLSEGALAGKGDAKPTHLYFTAANQKFLRIAAQNRDALKAPDLIEALVGPWQNKSKLSTLRWNNERGERLHALSASAPTKTKLRGTPGVEWLAFLGLQFCPTVTTLAGALHTTACRPEWVDGGAFHWCVWDRPASTHEVRSLLRLGEAGQDQRSALGLSGLFRAEIRRAETGGLGNFGPTTRR